MKEKKKHCVAILKNHFFTVSAVTFYDNNSKMITCGLDEVISVWDLNQLEKAAEGKRKTYKLIHTMPVHEVNSIS